MQTCRDLHVYREKERILWIFKGSFVNKKKRRDSVYAFFFVLTLWIHFRFSAYFIYLFL